MRRCERGVEGLGQALALMLGQRITNPCRQVVAQRLPADVACGIEIGTAIDQSDEGGRPSDAEANVTGVDMAQRAAERRAAKRVAGVGIVASSQSRLDVCGAEAQRGEVKRGAAFGKCHDGSHHVGRCIRPYGQFTVTLAFV